MVPGGEIGETGVAGVPTGTGWPGLAGSGLEAGGPDAAEAVGAVQVAESAADVAVQPARAASGGRRQRRTATRPAGPPVPAAGSC